MGDLKIANLTFINLSHQHSEKDWQIAIPILKY